NLIRVIAAGEWNIGQAPRLNKLLLNSNLSGAPEAEIDGSGITDLDTAGAWLLLRTKRELEQRGAKGRKVLFPDRDQPLVSRMEEDHDAPPVTHAPHPRGFVYLLERMGRGTVHALRQGYEMLGFLGRVAIETVEAILAPRRELPVPAFIKQIEETGL